MGDGEEGRGRRKGRGLGRRRGVVWPRAEPPGVAAWVGFNGPERVTVSYAACVV